MNDEHDNAADDKAMLAKLTAESPAIRMLKGALGVSGYAKPGKRDVAMFGYSAETKRLIIRAIKLDPALEESILAIAESAYGDGQDSL